MGGVFLAGVGRERLRITTLMIIYLRSGSWPLGSVL
jgi:hypothetical protein